MRGRRSQTVELSNATVLRTAGKAAYQGFNAIVMMSAFLGGSRMRKRLYLVLILFGVSGTLSTQPIPQELWGTWVVHRLIPTSTISCWGNKEARKLIGTEIEHWMGLFRWDKIVTKNLKTETTLISLRSFRRRTLGEEQMIPR
jgi:hypothetical protein